MRLWREPVIMRRAEMMPHHIAVLVDAGGHFVKRQVRNRGQFFGKLCIRRLRGQFELRHRGLELGYLGHQGRGARVVLGLLGIADFF
jgi:hypothetical protein